MWNKMKYYHLSFMKRGGIQNKTVYLLLYVYLYKCSLSKSIF